MMNLNFPLLDNSIRLTGSTFFVIEDTKVFANLIRMIYQYDGENGLKLFDEKQCAVKAHELMVITDVLGYDVNSAATLKLIYSDLEEQLNEKPEVKSALEQLTVRINELIGYELLEHELDLEEDDITILGLFKVLGIRIETANGTIYEKLLEIIQIYKYLTKKKLLVLINVCAYLTQNEMEQLIEYISLYNMEVLFLEPRRVSGTLQYILDEDYFLHHENIAE